MAVFLFVALSVYGGVNLYILRRSTQALAAWPAARTAFIAVFVFMVVAYPLGRALNARGGNWFTVFLLRAGSPYPAVMLTIFMWAAAVDLVRLADIWLKFIPGDPAWGIKARTVLFAAAWGSSLLIAALGAWNAARPKVTELTLRIDKKCAGRRELTVAMASDIHLGAVLGPARLERIVGMMKAMEPDIVLMPGDIVDESLTGRQDGRLMAAFAVLKPPLGVFASAGNHETYSGLDRNIAWLEKAGIRVLQDDAILVDGSFYVAGRNDPSSARFGRVREPLKELLEKCRVDSSKPIILLDHQPVHLEEAAAAGIDLQLSGHTHAGQLFPLNIINKKMYEKNAGWLRKGRTQYFISSGAGTWGPPVRTGSRSEVVLIHVLFKKP